MPLLPDRTKAQVEAALREFDRHQRASYRMSVNSFVLVWKGQTYPPKLVVELATGVDRRMFSGGSPTNDYLTALGFVILDLRKVGADALARELAA